nr:hypothetical protein [Tanacetum cinerariifolium]
RSSDEENRIANDRFKKGEGYHAVPPPLTGNYMPPKPHLSFARLDDSIYKFKISETVTSLAKDEKDAPETSTACVEKPKEDMSSASLIKDWKTDSDDDSVFTPKPIPAKIDFVKAGVSVKHVKAATPVKTVKQTEKSKNFCSNRMAKQSVLPANIGKGTGHRESRPVWNNVQRINHQNKFAPTAVFTRSSRIPVSVAKPKAVVSTSAAKPVNTAGPKKSVNFSRPRSCVWRPRVNAIDQLSKDNRWICTCVDYGHPQQALKNKRIVNSGYSRHMTGNKAYLADYQEIHDKGFVTFGSSRGKITGKVNSVKQIHAIVDGKAVVIS